MVLGVTHALFGIFIGVFTGASLAQGLFAILGALFPDIDMSRSYMGRHFKPLKFFLKHRGITHSIAAMIVLTVLLAISPIVDAKIYAYFFFLGYASHLVLDALTLEGITPLYPMKWRIKSRIKVGGLLEKLFFVLIVFAIASVIL